MAEEKVTLTPIEESQRNLQNLIDEEDVAVPGETTDTLLIEGKDDGKGAGEHTETEVKEEKEETLIAGVFKTNDELIAGVNKFADKLGLNTLQRRELKTAIKDAEESEDYSEIEGIFKDLQADDTKRTQASVKPDPKPGDKLETFVPRKLTDEEKATYIHSQVTKQLSKHPILLEFKTKGVDIPKDWNEFNIVMKDAADNSDLGVWDLMNRFQKLVVELEEKENQFLGEYDKTLDEGDKTKQIANDEGMKFLKQTNTDLDNFLTADDMAEIVAEALKHEESFEKRYGVPVVKKDAVERFFKNHKMLPKIKEIIVNARNNAKLETGKAKDDLKKKALETASTTSLSSKVDRIKRDKFDRTNANHVLALGAEGIDNLKKQLMEE